jgi:hypothetical protein
MTKEKIFLDMSAELVRFYTLLWHSLHAAAGEPQPEQPSEAQIDEQIRLVWSSLLPQLEKNAIVKNKIEKEYTEAVRIAAEYRKLGPKDDRRTDLEREAGRLASEARLKAAWYSDLVALFRSL